MACFTPSYSESIANSIGHGFVSGAGNRIVPWNFATTSRRHDFRVMYASGSGRGYTGFTRFDQLRRTGACSLSDAQDLWLRHEPAAAS